jgi:hypothetical protein
MYFAKASVKLGIYTNGVQWQFYTDLDKENIMDKEPFLTWNILVDPIPFDFLTLLQKSQFQSQLIKTFAERGRKQNLLVTALTKLLEPSADFVKLAVKDIETRALHTSVVEEWRPILVNAIYEWAKIKALDVALERPLEQTNTSNGNKKHFTGKTCPSCHTSGLGYRLSTCSCGHVFKQDHGGNQELEVIKENSMSKEENPTV